MYSQGRLLEEARLVNLFANEHRHLWRLKALSANTSKWHCECVVCGCRRLMSVYDLYIPTLVYVAREKLMRRLRSVTA